MVRRYLEAFPRVRDDLEAVSDAGDGEESVSVSEPQGTQPVIL
jgi:hypothetical protein